MLLTFAAAFINHNLRKEALAHCIKVGNCSAVVFSPSLAPALGEVLHELDPSLSDSCFSFGEQSTIPQARNLEEEVKSASPSDPPPVEGKKATGELFQLCIYSESCVDSETVSTIISLFPIMLVLKLVAAQNYLMINRLY